MLFRSPDAIAETTFADRNVIVASKSGSTLETSMLLEFALARGLEPQDLLVISDPGTPLAERGYELGAIVFESDVNTGGRFSALSPFGLVPAIYMGYSIDELQSLMNANAATIELVTTAVRDAANIFHGSNPSLRTLTLDGDPLIHGSAMWLEQLIAETTGKNGVGFVPINGARTNANPLLHIMHWQIVAATLALLLGNDPFDQPDVEAAKRNVQSILQNPESNPAEEINTESLWHSLNTCTYVTLQAYAPLQSASQLKSLRDALAQTPLVVTAGLGPQYLHSTGQLHKGGPAGLVAIQIIQRSISAELSYPNAKCSFQDLHSAQSRGDAKAMIDAGCQVWRIEVESLSQVSSLLGIEA